LTQVERTLPVYDAVTLSKFKDAARIFPTEEAFRAQKGDILRDFAFTVLQGALSDSSALKDETTENTLTSGRAIGRPEDIEILVNSFYKGNATFLGPFAVVREAIEAQVLSQIAAAQIGSRERQPKVARPDVIRTFKEERMKQAIEKFIKSLLQLQSEWENEYRAVVTANANAMNLGTVKSDLDKFRFDLEQIAPSLRISMREGAQSTIEKIVRSEKKNFLIISDRYQLDRSIQAYQTEVGRGNFALFQSEWETPLSICKRAADQVDFEFYADEDGNLRFKPPTYNRILKEHYALISKTDPKVRSAILVRFGGTDGEILQAVLRAASQMSHLHIDFAQKRVLAQKDLDNIERELKKVKLLTPEQVDTSKVSGLVPLGGNRYPDATVGLMQAEEADVQNRKNAGPTAWQEYQLPLSATIEVEVEAQKKASFLRSAEDRSLTKIEKSRRISEQDLQKLEDKLKITRVEIDAKKHEDLTIDEQISLQNAENVYRASQQQYTYKSLQLSKVSAEKKVSLYDYLKAEVDLQIKRLQELRSQVADKAENFISLLDRFTDEHRIHRVADYNLVSYQFTEAPPRFTHLEITGAPELVQLKPSEIYWAGGVDYDNWRQYGFMSESRQKAYFHSGDAARTYLRALLGRERGRVFTGEMTVRGDSKYRLGDCVFIECIGMYYYVMGVTQSLTFGGEYNTQLTLGYGRRIGEIIPHPFDTLGKIMIEIYQNEVETLLAREAELAGKAKQQKDIILPTTAASTPPQELFPYGWGGGSH